MLSPFQKSISVQKDLTVKACGRRTDW